MKSKFTWNRATNLLNHGNALQTFLTPTTSRVERQDRNHRLHLHKVSLFIQDNLDENFHWKLEEILPYFILHLGLLSLEKDTTLRTPDKENLQTLRGPWKGWPTQWGKTSARFACAGLKQTDSVTDAALVKATIRATVNVMRIMTRLGFITASLVKTEPYTLKVNKRKKLLQWKIKLHD